jgi:tetratricopeptide (TPR) repeat protein
MKYSLLLGCTVALVAFADVAMAKTPDEVESIARSTSVQIKLQKDQSVGSGVIVHQQGDLYTLVTNRHVVCGRYRGVCADLIPGEKYNLRLPDGQIYQINKKAIKLLNRDLDLVIIQFRSNRKYAQAQFAPVGNLKINNAVYTYGFPGSQPGSSAFGIGDVVAVSNKQLSNDNGYTVIYNAPTLPGMSGGGVFDSNGQLVAIHGRGDLYGIRTEVSASDSRIGTKIGFNRGILVRWLLQGLGEVGIKLGSARSLSDIRVARQEIPNTADEHFIVGYNKHIEPGNDLLAGRREAIREFDLAIKLNPRYAIAYLMRGYIHSQLNNLQQAFDDYSQVIAINPNYSEAYNNRGSVRYKTKDFVGAISDLDKAIVAKPDNNLPYYNRGSSNLEINNFAGALKDFDQAISLGLKTVEVYNNRGLAKHSLRNYLGAIDDFNIAIKTSSGYALSYYNRGRTKFSLKDYDGSLIDVEESIRLDPKHADSYGNRSILKDIRNDLIGAMSDINKAIELAPNNARHYAQRGAVKTKLNDFAGATSDFNKAIEIDPNLASIYTGRSLLKVRLNDTAGAINDLDRAILLNPENVEIIYIARGVLKTYLKDIPGAMSDFNKAIEIDPKISQAYFYRGFLRRKIDEVSGAMNDFNKVIELNPEYAEAYVERGALKMLKLDDRRGAIQDFQRAAQLFRKQGNDPELQKMLGLLKALGETE